MMKTLILTFLIVFSWHTGFSQSREIDSLKRQLTISKEDKSQVLTLLQLSSTMMNVSPDSGVVYAQLALALAHKINFPQGEVRALFSLAFANRILGDIPKSLQLAFNALQISEDNDFKGEVVWGLYMIGSIYEDGLHDHSKAIGYFKRAKQMNAAAPDEGENEFRALVINLDIGIAYLRSNALDSASVFLKKILPDTSSVLYPVILMYYGHLQFKKGNRQAALAYSQKAIGFFFDSKAYRSEAEAFFFRATYFRDLGQADSCIYYARKSLSKAELISYKQYILKAANLLAETYELKNAPEALRFYKIAKLANDEVFGEKKVQELQRIILQEIERQQEVEKAKTAYRNQVRQYLLLAGLGVLLLFSFMLYRNNRQKQKANVLLQSKNRELEIETALERVRSKTMAMHKSDELLEVTSVLYNQLQSLGLQLWNCGITRLEPDSYTAEIWMSRPDGQMLPDSFTVPMDRVPVYKKLYEIWKNKEPFHVLTIQGNEVVRNTESLAALNIIPVDKMRRDTSRDLPEQMIFYTFNFSEGCLCIIATEKFQDEGLLKRFATTFRQAYTRFLDLQKAEALAEQAHVDLIKIQTEKKRAEDALAELRSTQSQLIQSEKLASLGELTAGIAHEIQNPLNFVNNFSELSVDLAKELKEEIEKTAIPEKDKGYIGEILTDLTQNQQKINHHGKRAAAIVSGMLQHARTSTGKKEPTDLNALADEYLRLSYHGLRAKDPTFKAKMETHFDPAIGKVEVIPQDMGRVLLNLINNAFYAVQQRTKQASAASPGLPGAADFPGVQNLESLNAGTGAPPSGGRGDYEPTVTVSTQKMDNQIVIKVKDNGTGIPNDMKARIFQPFFTTKPTGQGTGLGLSLAYDIVTKGHGGALELESTEGEGTTFSILIPV